MLNCIIIDDDATALTLLAHYTTSTSWLNLVQTFSNPVEAANYIHTNGADIDLAFLDIEMPGLSGIQMLSTIKNFPPVILTTAKENYAVQAFDHKVLHYLLKPIEYSRFLRALEKVNTSSAPDKQNTDYIFVRENGVITKVQLNSIIYFEALGDYVKVHCREKTHVVYTTMKKIEEKLRDNPQFTRIHRSYFININYLDSFDADAAVVANKTIPIGNKYRADLHCCLMIL